jgi:hypothetical protein
LSALNSETSEAPISRGEKNSRRTRNNEFPTQKGEELLANAWLEKEISRVRGELKILLEEKKEGEN